MYVCMYIYIYIYDILCVAITGHIYLNNIIEAFTVQPNKFILNQAGLEPT